MSDGHIEEFHRWRNKVERDIENLVRTVSHVDKNVAVLLSRTENLPDRVARNEERITTIEAKTATAAEMASAAKGDRKWMLGFILGAVSLIAKFFTKGS